MGLLAKKILHLRRCARTTRRSSGSGAATTDRMTSKSVSLNGSRPDASRISTMLLSRAFAVSKDSVPSGGGRCRNSHSSCGIVIVPVPWSNTDHSSAKVSTASGFTDHFVTCIQSQLLSLAAKRNCSGVGKILTVAGPNTVANATVACLCSGASFSATPGLGFELVARSLENQC